MDTSKPSEYGSLIGLGITILILVGLSFLVDMDFVRSWIEGAGIWAPLVFILLKISTLVFAPLSGSPLYPLTGLLFGFWPGILYIIIGDFLGLTIAFYISRFFGQKIVFKLLSGKEEGIVTRIINHISDVRGFFQACLTLFAMPELLAYGAGLSRLPYYKFILTLIPLSASAASILVLFGSKLNIENGGVIVGIVVPIVGALVVLTGASLFLKAVAKKGG